MQVSISVLGSVGIPVIQGVGDIYVVSVLAFINHLVIVDVVVFIVRPWLSLKQI